MAPDEYFISAFNSHISWPVKLTSEFLLAKSESGKGFDAQLQEWMAREQGWLVIRTPEGWRELVDRALAMLHAGRERADAIVGVSRLEASHPDFDVRLGADGLIRPYAAPDFRCLKRRQDVEPLYFLEGSLYASAVEVLVAKKSFCHDRTLGYPVPRWKAFEIDELIDLICVEALLKHREELRAAE